MGLIANFLLTHNYYYAIPLLLPMPTYVAYGV